MSKECVSNCPRIAVIKENFPEDAHPDVSLLGVLSLWEASYDCAGPIPTEVEVEVGLPFRRRTITKPGFECGQSE